MVEHCSTVIDRQSASDEQKLMSNQYANQRCSHQRLEQLQQNHSWWGHFANRIRRLCICCQHADSKRFQIETFLNEKFFKLSNDSSRLPIWISGSEVLIQKHRFLEKMYQIYRNPKFRSKIKVELNLKFRSCSPKLVAWFKTKFLTPKSIRTNQKIF